MALIDSFFSRDVRALSRVISVVENRQPGYQEMLGRLYSRSGKSFRIGITGPPGAGKSTLLNCLARKFLVQGLSVGVVAVDPTSPFTGGALLGDRVRLENLPTDGSFYFRSMATRGATGGLAGATDNVTVVLDAFGYDITLVETVGVGQVELDIIDTCDCSVVVVVPESGDSVQTMKAGLIEIADIFCVNKADRPGADQLAGDLEQAVMLRRASETSWQVPVIVTEALRDKNIDTLQATIENHRKQAIESGQYSRHRAEQIKKKILRIIRNRFAMDIEARLEEKLSSMQLSERVLGAGANPYEVAAEFYDQFHRE